MKGRFSRVFTVLAVVLFGLILFSSTAQATDPPWDTDTFRGDVDGNFIVDIIDVNATKDLSLLRCVNHLAVIPSHICNGDTHDMNGDTIIDIIDVNAHRDMSLLRPYTPSPDLSWTINTAGIPDPISGSAPISVTVQNNVAIGRPGIVVHFSIAAGPATLSGREYNPIKDGVREHEITGAINMLAVTTTDFGAADLSGATEATVTGGTQVVELECTGNAAVTINIDIVADALTGIPAISTSKIIACDTGNVEPSDPGATPNPIAVLEGTVSGSIAVSSTDLDLGDTVTISDTGTGTCTGTITGLPIVGVDTAAGSFTYTALAEETVTSCTIIIQACDQAPLCSLGSPETITVNIIEDPTAPGFANLPAAEFALAGDPYTFVATKTDTDVPMDTLTCSIPIGVVPGSDTPTAAALGGGDTETDTVADADAVDAGAPINGIALADGQWNVRRNRRGELTTFDTTGIPGGATITGVTLNVRYGTADAGGTMTNFVQQNAVDTTILPAPTSGAWVDAPGYDLFAVGITSVAAINTLVIGYSNNTGGGGNNRSIDFDVINVTVDYTAVGPMDTCGWGTLADTPGISGSTCTYAGTATGSGICTVTLEVSDGGLQTQAVLTIDVLTNQRPSDPGAPNTVTVAEGAVSGPIAVSSTDLDLGDTVTISRVGGTCTGTVTVLPIIGVDTASGNFTYTPAVEESVTSCTILIQACDQAPLCSLGSPETITVVITEVNTAPVWAIAPPVAKSTPISTVDSYTADATDSDLLNTIPEATLNCTLVSNACSFPVVVTGGPGAGAVTCNVSYTTPACTEVCDVVIQAADGGAPSLNVQGTTTITVTGSINVTGINVGILPLVTRVNTNYPPEAASIVMDFDASVCSATVAVECTDVFGATTVVPGTAVALGSQVTWTPTAVDLPGRNDCQITGIITSPTCLNCVLPYSFSTAIADANCGVAQGGLCGGFISNAACAAADGENGAGLADTLTVDLVAPELAGPLVPSNNPYVLVEQSLDAGISDPDVASNVLRIERFATAGSVTFDAADGLRCGPVKITVAYKGGSGVGVPNQGDLLGPIGEKRENYMTTIFNNVDARHVVIPMRRTSGVLNPMGFAGSGPKATIWAEIPNADFQAYVGAVPLQNGLPDPMRAGFGAMTMIDLALANLNLTDLLITSTVDSTATICAGVLSQPMGGLPLPTNMMLPDMIRQDWLAGCTGGSAATSPMNTSWSARYYRQNETRILLVLGVSVRSELFNVFMGLVITDLPIVVTAVGTQTVTIPGYILDMDIGSPVTPVITALEVDMRDPAGAGSGTAVALEGHIQAIPPVDAERALLAPSDPNLSNAAFYPLADGRFIKQNAVFMLGANFGSDGLGLFAIGNLVSIDDANYTVFARSNAMTKIFTNVNPWGGSSTNTGVISVDPFNTSMSSMWAPNSGTGDAELDYLTANYGAVATFVRPLIDDYNGGAAAVPFVMPGAVVATKAIGPPESAGGLVAHTNFLLLPVMNSPASPGYYDSLPQLPNVNAVAGGQPINRNGQIVRGTATTPANDNQTRIVNAVPVSYFDFTSPVDSLTGSRLTHIYTLNLLTGKKFGNLEPDNIEITKAPRYWLENNFVQYWGSPQGVANTNTTLPWLTSGPATLEGISDDIPDMFELQRAAMTGQTEAVEWSLGAIIVSTDPTTGWGPFDWNNIDLSAFYAAPDLGSAEKHQFILR